MDPLESEIAALGGLSAHDLRIAWRRLHRDKPPRCMSRRSTTPVASDRAASYAA